MRPGLESKPFRPPTAMSGGLGKAKRLKRPAMAMLAEKENIILSRQSQPPKPFLKSTRQQNPRTNVPQNPSNVKKRRVLQQKSNNVQPKRNTSSSLLKKYPMSEHVVKPILCNDETWIGQQQTLFTSILNETFASQVVKDNLWTDDRLDEIRRTAFAGYQCDEFQIIMRRLNNAFKTQKLMVTHTHCFRDIGIRSSVRRLLCDAYSSSWLALGLELITGRICGSLLHESQEHLQFLIDNFLLDHVDTEHDNLDDISKDQLSAHRILSLLFILDYLKKIIPGPNLFRSQSDAKSSVDIAQKLSKLFLAGQGDINHRLTSITKYQLIHIQYPLDDFQYEITNLAIDMRDGIRLTKMIEIFTGRDDLSPQLRWPAQGVTQRVHNLSIALSAIQLEGLELVDVTANDIEAGSREKTLSVLWCLISRWRLPQYLSKIDLKAEIRFLTGILRIRELTLPSIEDSAESSHAKDLMEWVTIVCSLCEKPLRNFTTDFSDNAPFECIMNFYFPREGTTLPQQYQEYLGGMLGKTNGVRSETHFPDSRVITLMLGVLASRVLLQNDRIDAATKIQRVFRKFANADLREKDAAITIQRAYRRYRDRKVEVLINTTITIQALARGYLFRSNWRRRALRNALVGHGPAYRIGKVNH